MELYEICGVILHALFCGIFQFVNNIFLTEYLFMHFFTTFEAIVYSQR